MFSPAATWPRGPRSVSGRPCSSEGRAESRTPRRARPSAARPPRALPRARAPPGRPAARPRPSAPSEATWMDDAPQCDDQQRRHDGVIEAVSGHLVGGGGASSSAVGRDHSRGAVGVRCVCRVANVRAVPGLLLVSRRQLSSPKRCLRWGRTESAERGLDWCAAIVRANPGGPRDARYRLDGGRDPGRMVAPPAA